MNPNGQRPLKVLVDHGDITEHGLEWIKTKGIMNPNDPAFPLHPGLLNEPNNICGVTVRAYLAGRAMQGILSNKAIMEWVRDTFDGKEIEAVSVLSVSQADHLIAELNKKAPLAPCGESPCDAFNKEMKPKLEAHKADIERIMSLRVP